MKYQLYTFLLLLFLPVSMFSQSGSAIVANGSSSYAIVTHDSTLNADSALTIEAWIKPTSFGPNSYNNVIISKDGWQFGEQGYTLRCGGNGVLSFNFGVQGSWQEATSSQGALTLNVWQHVAGTFDGSTMNVYVNGVLVGSSTYNGTIAASNYDLTIGRISYTAGGNRFFVGEIDQVRLWGAALSQTTLRDYMCQPSGATHPNNARLKAYYNFNNATTTFTDLSPNGNNGSLVGAAVVPSGAAIGTESVYDYTSPFSASLTASSGETLSLSNVAGSPDGVQFYRIDGAPSPLNLPTGFGSFDTKYWGVFFAGGTSPTADLSYNYASGTYLNSNNECDGKIAARSDASIATWTSSNSQVDASNDMLNLSAQGSSELIVGLSNAPYANIAVSANSICQGDTATLSIPLSAGPGYQWVNMGTPLTGDTSNVLETTLAGVYHVMISDGVCSYTTDTVSVSVNPLPTVALNSLADLCILGGTDTLIGSPAGGTFAGPGVTGSTIDPVQAGLGSHIITYSYTDSTGCAGIAQDTLLINPNPTVSFPSPFVYCENEPAFNMLMAVPNGGIYNGPGVAQNFFTPLAAGVGTHTIYYNFIDSSGCTAEDSSEFIINPIPATPTVTQVGNDLQSSSPTGNQWYNGSTPIQGATNVLFTPPNNGTYTVVVTDSNGCSSDTSNALIFVGLELASNLQFDLLPNPASNNTKLILETDWLGELEIQVVDLQGKILFKEATAAQGNRLERELSLEGIASGLYMVRIIGESKFAAKKLVIK